MKAFISIFLLVPALLILLLARFALLRIRQPTTLALWAVKVFVSALSPLLLLLGFLLLAAGRALDSLPLSITGALGGCAYLLHIIRVLRPEVVAAQGQVLPVKPHSVSRAHRHAQPQWERDIPFYTLPGGGRQLLCDVWRPPASVKPSGQAFVYLHGSAWAVLDKDFGTRRFFRRLAGQRHVVMDVAYRLWPETDLEGMVQDARQAVGWMKMHAADYGVDPARILVGGGSAGAHIALLMAYREGDPQFSVAGVIALYGQADLAATYYHTCQHLVSRSALGAGRAGAGSGAPGGASEGGGMPDWLRKRMGSQWQRLGLHKGVEPGMLAPMLGGSPADNPDAYALFSPQSYVHHRCPPTLFIHGGHDILAPVAAIRKLQRSLTEQGVYAPLHVIPQTDHAFDLVLPVISPSARYAWREVERFLARF